MVEVTSAAYDTLPGRRDARLTSWKTDPVARCPTTPIAEVSGIPKGAVINGRG